MGFQDTAKAMRKKLYLDSHHTTERFGVIFGVFVLTGALIGGTTVASAVKTNRDVLSDTALYTETFETSKSGLNGEVDGVYTSKDKTRALVMMHFEDGSQISYDAMDYQAFLLGTDKRLQNEEVKTDGIEGSFEVFGSSGYVGVLLDSDQPFDKQVLNLTIRSHSQLAVPDEDTDADETNDEDEGEETADGAPEEKTSKEHDQWRVFVNPGANGTKPISALDADEVDPSQIYYDIVTKPEEDEARKTLDGQLLKMRADLTRIDSYTSDLQTTKVDGMFLRPPKVPALVDGDKVTGKSADENDGESTLTLDTKTVAPGGFDFDWRKGDVYDGYLDDLVKGDEGYSKYLQKKNQETDDADAEESSEMKWILSDGTDLTNDYDSADTTMQPLINVMNNLSQAYSDYEQDKRSYQTDQMMDLLHLEVDLKDVKSNGSTNDSEKFLVQYK